MVVAPTTWELGKGKTIIRYVAGDAPRLTYKNDRLAREFAPIEIMREDSPALGELVSVCLERIIDVESTMFTLLLPRVRLDPPAFSEASVTVLGITTKHLFSFSEKRLGGPTQSSKVVRFTGTVTAKNG